MAASVAALAQRISFVAEASAVKIGVNDQVQVTFRITDVPNLVSLTPGGFSGFEVLSGPFQQQSSSFSMSGNQRYQSSTTSLTYVLRPRNVGRFTFPVAVARDAAGKTYQSNALRIEVVPDGIRVPSSTPGAPQGRQRSGVPQQVPPRQPQQPRMPPQRSRPSNFPAGSWGAQPTGSQQPASRVSDKDIFLRAVPDKTTAYAGEQVMVRYKVFTRLPMEMAMSRPVAQAGCWVEEADPGPQPKDGTPETVNGRPFSSFVLKQTALYPQQEGTLTLSPAEGEGLVYIPLPGADLRSPAFDDPLFADDPFLSQGGMAALLRGTDPFGSLGVQDRWDRRPVRLASAPAAIRVLPLPEAGRPADFSGAVGQLEVTARLDRYQTAAGQPATLTLTITGQGSLKMMQPPTLALPAGMQAYEPAVKDSLVRTPGGLQAIRTVTYAIGADKPGVYLLPDIRVNYFDPKAAAYREAVAPLQAHLTIVPAADEPSPAIAGKGVGRPALWLLAAVPVLALAGYAVLRKKRPVEQPAAVGKPAALNTDAALRSARTRAEAGDTGCLTALGDACWGYLGQKLAIPTSLLSRGAVLEALGTSGANAETAARMARLLDHLQMARYAPAAVATGAATLTDNCDEAAALIRQLETEIRA